MTFNAQNTFQNIMKTAVATTTPEEWEMFMTEYNKAMEEAQRNQSR